MKTLLVLALLVLLASAQAAVQDGARLPTGSLTPTAQTTTGASANQVSMQRGKYRTLIVTVWNTAGTATVELDINCMSGTPSTGWGQVANSSTPLTVSTTVLSVVYPACLYQVNTTACSSCSVNAAYFVGPEIQ